MNTSRIWTKPQTQQTLKALRKAGYQVTKLCNGYDVSIPFGRTVLKAMNGQSSYLVRYDDALFQD